MKTFGASEGSSSLTRNNDASELSSDDRGESEIVEAEAVEYDDLVDDEHGATIESLPLKKRRSSGVRAEKSFNEALEKILRDINSKPKRTKKSLA